MTKSRKVVLIILTILTVVASVTKIFIGLDFDENYITVLGARLLQGDHLFRECWDLYQTTGLTMAMVLGVFQGVTGGYEGAILFCRIFVAILQLLLGFFVWDSLKAYFKNADFAGLIVANMLPRGTMNLEYGFLSCNYILVAMILLFLVSRKWSQNRIRSVIYLVISGVLFSLGILSYPTMIIATAVLIIYFLKDKGYREQGIIFMGTCFISALMFFAYVFHYISPAEMWNNIFQGILMDESHGNGNLLKSFLDSFTLSKEKIIQIEAIMVGAIITYGLFWWKVREKLPYVYHVMIWSSLTIIGLNIFAIRPCGVYGLQIRYLLIMITGGVVLYKLYNRELNYLFFYMGLFMFLGTLLGSNLSIAENGAFLYLCVIAIVLGQGEQVYSQSITRWGAAMALVVFCTSLIFIKGYLVRVNGTGPANIFETREQIDFGPFKGIWVYPEQKNRYSMRKEDINQYVKENDVTLILSHDPIYNLYGQHRFSSVTALTTPVYGKQWVEYYNNRDYVQPTVVLIDKQYLEVNELFDYTDFGEFLQEEYDMNTLCEAQGFWILRR